MNHKKLSFILISILLIFYSNLFAQEKTKYQKKTIEIKKKYVQQILISQGKWNQQAKAELFYSNEESVDMLLGFGLISSPNLIEKITKELNQAEKLKTNLDYKREEEIINREEKQALAKKIKDKVEKYNKTDIGYIQNRIKEKFNKWNKKGEFEKNEDYNNRLKNESKTKFDEVCTIEIHNRINTLKTWSWHKEISKYNTENEKFNIKFILNKIEWNGGINVEIKNASKFKANWSNLKFEVSKYDWGFSNNSLFPSKVSLKKTNYSNKKTVPHTFITKNNITSEILYSFNPLEIDNIYLKNYTYSYSDYVKEKKQLDLIKIKKNNRTIDSIYKTTNEKLLKHPFNFKKIKISDYKKIKTTEDKELFQKLSLIGKEYEKSVIELENQNTIEYKKNKNIFENKNDFNDFYKKGNLKFNEEVDKRKTFNFLEKHSVFIKSMNLQQNKKESFGSLLAKNLLSNSSGSTISSKDYTVENNIRNNTIEVIKNSKNKVFYPEVMNFVVQKNKKLYKEWSKNNQYFLGKSDFVEAYISENYSEILKKNKKKR